VVQRPALVVFDMAGTTVFDSDGVVAQCLVSAFAEQGLTVSLSVAMGLMGLPKPEAIRQLLIPLYPEGTEAEQEALAATLHKTFLEKMLLYYRTHPEVRPTEGAETVFQALRQAGILVALDTGFSRDILDTIVARLGWEDKIDATVASDEVPCGRPHPDMVFHLMRHLGVTDAAQVAKVGDTPVDLQEGTAAGCGWTIGVWEGSHTHEQLAAHPHTHLLPNITHLLPLFYIASDTEL